MRSVPGISGLLERLHALAHDGVSRWREHVLPRYQSLQPSEQRLLLLAAVGLPVMLLIFGLILPLKEHVSRLQQDVVVLQQQAAEATRLARLLRQHGPNGAHPAGVMAVVETQAKKHGLRSRMTRIRPVPGGKGQRLMLQMKDAPYAGVIAFARDLNEAGVALESMKIQQGSASGLVHVSMVIAGR